MGSFEILEHTADVGLRARAESLEDLFATATEGMAVIAGAWHPGEGEPVAIEVDATDLAGVLVEWLGEALYEQDARNASLAGAALDEVSASGARGTVVVRPFVGEPSEGVQIKAVTYHQLSVEPDDDGWVATVFFDI